MTEFNEGIAPSLTSSISLSPSDANNSPVIEVKPRAKKVGVSVPVNPDTKEKLIKALENEYPATWALLPIGKNKNACGKYSKGWASAEPISREALINEVRSNSEVVGIGLRSGTVSGNILALDEDGSTAHQLVLDMTEGVGLPRSVSFSSGKSGRLQTLFWIPDDSAALLTELGFTLFKVTTEKGEQLEFRFNKCYSCLPPSHHPETGQYQWVNSPQDTEIAVAPDWVIASIMNHLKEREERSDLSEVTTAESNEPVRVSPWDVVKAHFIIDNLPAEAADLPYATWLKILQAAHSVDCSDMMLEKCVEFSKRSEKFKEGEVERKWEGFTQEGNATGAVKLGSLVKIGGEYGIDYRASLREESLLDSDEEEFHLPEWSNTPENYHCQAGVWKMIDHWAEIKPEAPRQGRPDFKPHDLKRSMFGYAEVEDNTGDKKKISVWRTHEFEPQLDVALYVERSLRGGMGGGGLVFRVERKQGSRTIIQRATLLSNDMIKSADFVAALQRAIGNRVSCTIRPDQLVKYFRNLHQDYFNKGGKHYNLADRVGKQSDGTWVLSADRQYNADGSLTTEEESQWVFNDNLISQTTGASDEGVDTVPLPAIAPFNPDVDGSLKQLLSIYWSTTSSYFGSLKNHVALNIGAVVAGLYYDEILATEKFFPIYYNYGEKATGKTTSANVALALIGLKETGAMVSPTYSALMERLKLMGNLPVFWDDPRLENKLQLDKVVQGVYNGSSRVVKGNTQKPHSPVILTTNFALGETNGAVQTRTVGCEFLKVDDIDSTKWDELNDICTKVSAAFPLLLGLGYDRNKVRALSSRLRERMPGVNDRIPHNLAIFVHYAMEFLQLVDGDVPGFMNWVMDSYAPGVAVRQEDKSNLEDFLEKVVSLLAENKVGGWNVKMFPENPRGEDEFLAVWLAPVYEAVKREFKDTLYSRSMLGGLIDKAGGKGTTTTVVKFHADQQTSIAASRSNVKPPTKTCRAVLIPLSIAQKCGYSDEDHDLPTSPKQHVPGPKFPATAAPVGDTDLDKIRRDLLDDEPVAEQPITAPVGEQPITAPVAEQPITEQSNPKPQEVDVQVSLAYSVGQRVLVKDLPGVWKIVKVPSKADIRKGTVHRYTVHPNGDPLRRITVPVTQITPAPNTEPQPHWLDTPDNDADMPF